MNYSNKIWSPKTSTAPFLFATDRTAAKTMQRAQLLRASEAPVAALLNEKLRTVQGFDKPDYSNEKAPPEALLFLLQQLKR